MARDKWFETVAFAQQLAKKRLPKSVYSALLAASEKGITVADNVDAFGELGFAPHVIGAIEKRDLSTTVMGQEISLPVVRSPSLALLLREALQWGCRHSRASLSRTSSPPIPRRSSRFTGSVAETRSL